MSPKKTGNTPSCSLLMYLLQKIPADAECAPRAAARGTALRAIKVLTSCQILPQPLSGSERLCNRGSLGGLTKLGEDNMKTPDVIRPQAIHKTPEVSDVMLRQFHVATHTSPEWALHVLADDIPNTITEHFNLDKNSWAQ